MQGKQRKWNPPGAPPRSLAAPACGWRGGGRCGGSARPVPPKGGPGVLGPGAGSRGAVPAPSPSSSCAWRAAWDLTAKGCRSPRRPVVMPPPAHRGILAAPVTPIPAPLSSHRVCRLPTRHAGFPGSETTRVALAPGAPLPKEKETLGRGNPGGAPSCPPDSHTRAWF